MTGRDDAFQRAADLQTRWEAVDVQLRHLRLAFENAGRERDELTVRLSCSNRSWPGFPVRARRAAGGAGQGRGPGGGAAGQAEATSRHGATAARREPKLRRQAQRARARADKAQAALAAARASLPRRVVRRLRARRAKPSS